MMKLPGVLKNAATFSCFVLAGCGIDPEVQRNRAALIDKLTIDFVKYCDGKVPSVPVCIDYIAENVDRNKDGHLSGYERDNAEAIANTLSHNPEIRSATTWNLNAAIKLMGDEEHYAPAEINALAKWRGKSSK